MNRERNGLRGVLLPGRGATGKFDPIPIAVAIAFIMWAITATAIFASKLDALPQTYHRLTETALVLCLVALLAYSTYVFRPKNTARSIYVIAVLLGISVVAGIVLDLEQVHRFALSIAPIWDEMRSAAERSVNMASISLLVVGLCGIIQALHRSIVELHSERARLIAERRERLIVADALAASDAKFRALAESTAASIYILQGDRMVYANAAASVMTGHSIADLLAMRLWELFPKDEQGRLRQVVRSWQRSSERSTSFEMRYRTAEGEIRWGETTVAQIRFEGDPAIIGTTFDITERKLAEQELEQREEWFRKLVQDASAITCVLGPDGHLKFVSSGNHLVEEYDVETELIGKNLFDFIHPDDLEDTLDAFQEVVARQGNMETRRLRFRTRSGEWRVLEASGRNLIHDPVVKGVVVTARNVTKRVELEEQLRQSQKMEMLGQLAGGVAHDFNNLLMSILIHCEFLETEKCFACNGVEDVREIRKAGERAASLTRQLLAFSGRERHELTAIDLSETVRDLNKMLTRLIGERIDLLTETSEEPCIVRANLSQLEQVIINLVVNARDAMPDGGKLFITTSIVQGESSDELPGNTEPQRYVRLCVRDTGSGMDEDTRTNAFEPFFTTKDAGKGTGLGLAMVSEIVKRYRGFVDVSSSPGEGTSFVVLLPSAECEATPLGTSARRMDDCQHIGSKSILVVEDDPLVRRVTGHALARAGYMTLLAESSTEAIQICKDLGNQIDLVLSDVIMPGMNGPDLAPILQEYRPGLKVIFMSGYTADALAQYSQDDGDVRLIRKPFTVATLIENIQAELPSAKPA